MMNAMRASSAARAVTVLGLAAALLVAVPGALVRGSSIGLQSSDVENVETHGDWTVLDRVDLIDDSREVVASTESEDARLALVCRSNGSLQLLAILDFAFTGIEDQRQAIYRVDRNDPIDHNARVVFDGSFTRLDWTLRIDAASAARSLIEQAKSGTRLVFRTFAANDMPITKVFSLAGFTAAATRVLESCRYDDKKDSPVLSRVLKTLGQPFEATATISHAGPIPLFAASGGFDLLERTLENVETVRVLRRAAGETAERAWYLVELEDGYQAWAWSVFLDLGEQTGGATPPLKEGSPYGAEGTIIEVAGLRRVPRLTGATFAQLAPETPVRITRKATAADGGVWYLVETAGREPGWVDAERVEINQR